MTDTVEKIWRLLDICDEIWDDLEDIEEDMHSINCNRVLISFEELGSEVTRSEYKTFFEELCDELNLYGPNDNLLDTHPVTLAMKRLSCCEAALDNRLSSIKQRQEMKK